MAESIILDSREPPAFAGNIIAKFGAAGIVVEQMTLETGDVTWNTPQGLVVLERKTISDLISSIRDGRWSSQVARLTHEQVPIVLVQGNWSINELGQVVPANLTTEPTNPALNSLIDGCLLVAQWHGVTVARCGESAEAAANRVLELYKLSQRETHDSINPLTPRTQKLFSGPGKRDKKELEALFLLMGFPGIGVKSAEMLLTRFGSVDNIIRVMSLDNHKEVPGKYKSVFSHGRDILRYRKRVA